MKTLVVATGNLHKVQEIKQILEPYGYQVLGADECGGMPEVVEDGATFRENAVKKAVAAAKALNRTVLADDSGLEVFALGGEPGVFSARYAGEGGNDGRNLAKLLLKLEGVSERGARFVCSIAVASPDGTVLGICEGEVRGRIAAEAHGDGGFGYDPAFIPDGYSQTFGELPAAVKNSLSHRANALRAALHEIFHVI
ncbi:MAG: RdgB/HAM1 family non-canonical purine NTP pyrophosphatase [Victivallales bacterium]|nr:RdgB/HAM1 family non-canonical purine NTP pyrophosphatase [Victivallales bacterium]